MDIKTVITNISSVVTLLPIISGLVAYAKCNNIQRLFLIYLCFGFVVDFVQFFITDNTIQEVVYNLYAVIEICFVVWFIRALSWNEKAIKIYRLILFGVVPAWIICHFITNYQMLDFAGFSKWFDGGMAIIIAFMTAFEILEITKKYDERSFLMPELWFQGGLFLYFFSTFFIFFLMETSIRPKIWFIHNLINVVECILLSIAFYNIIYKNSKKKMEV